MPLVGQLRARGLTPYQLSLDIAAELKRKYIQDPKVSVEVETYRPFFILGEVNKPGGYPYVNGMTAEAAVAIAEGYTERAKKRMVRLTRRFWRREQHCHGADRLPGAAWRHYLRSRTLLLKLT